MPRGRTGHERYLSSRALDCSKNTAGVPILFPHYPKQKKKGLKNAPSAIPKKLILCFPSAAKILMYYQIRIYRDNKSEILTK